MSRGIEGSRARRLASACCKWLAFVVVTATVWTGPDVARANVISEVPFYDEPSISAYGDTVAWSELSSRTGEYFLNTAVGGQATRLPVPPSKRPFDVDLGPGPDGSVWAVYSRCKQATTRCRLFRFSFGLSAEAPLKTTGRASRSDTDPAIWKKRVAFVRRATSGKARPSIYARNLENGRQSREVAMPRRVCPRFGSGGKKIKHVRCLRRTGQGLGALDLRGNLIANLAAFTYRGAPGHGYQEIRLARVGGSDRLVAREIVGEARAHFSQVGFDGRELLFGRRCEGENCRSRSEGTARFFSYAPRSGRYLTGAPSTQVVAFACWNGRCFATEYAALGVPMPLVDSKLPVLRRIEAPTVGLQLLR